MVRKALSIIIVVLISLIITVSLLLLIHIYFLSEVEWLPRPTLARGWSTPEEAVHQTLSQGIEPWQPVANPIIVSSFLIDRGWVLLYAGQASSHAVAPSIGLGTVKQGWRGWYLTSQIDLQSATLTNASQSARFEIIPQPFSRNNFLIVTGRAHIAAVQQVQATFDTGRTLRGDIYDQSFALMDEGASNVCSLRMLDARGSVIETVQWPQCQNDQPFRTK